MTDFIFLHSKVIAVDDCSHEIKRHLLLGRKAMTNLDSVLKCRYITLLAKVHKAKAVVFPIVMYECEYWIIKNAEPKPRFSLSSFTFIKRIFSSSLLSAMRVVSYAYLRLLIFLPAILIPTGAYSSLTFHTMYSA